MLILHLITGLRRGGAEVLISDLLTSTNDQQHDYKVLAFGKDFPLKDVYIRRGIDLTIIPLNKNPFDFVVALWKIISYIKKNGVDILHAHMYHALVVSFFCKLFVPSLKIVFTSHSINFGNKWRELVIGLLRPVRDADVVFSTVCAERDIYVKNVFIIPNGVHLPEPKTILKYHIFTFVAVGRLEYVKNHLCLLDAAVKLVDEGLVFQIIIAGDGIMKYEIQEKIKEYGLEKIVILYGYTETVSDLLNSAHCFLMPSLWEGMPISILEAGMAKLPVIATPVGSIPEILGDDCGYVVNFNDFADRMIYLMNNYHVAQICGENLYTRVIENYSIQNTLKCHEDMYYTLK
jgi:glycosyltransferase involved in cell wall biosynthesis